ncbi:nitrate- and nitrite sensing domain-containing protein [Nonomuraea sp. ATR24]|uniref:nitrate- and nitrite sensing domain-containing protein n=1 Tax=Nonomuraea sp. ATR24 TaxID=1676744 RepID=UPI0035C1E2DD
MTMSPARGLPLRARLFLLPAVPALLLIAATGAGVADLAAARAEAASGVRQVDVALAAEDLVHALQRERTLAAGRAAGEERFAADLAAARRATDGALAPLLSGRAGAGRVRESLPGPGTLAEIRAAGENAGNVGNAAGTAEGAVPGAAVPGAAGTTAPGTAAVPEATATAVPGESGTAVPGAAGSAVPGAAAVPGEVGARPRHLTVFTAYTTTIAAVLAASHRAGPLEALARGKEAAAQQRALVTGALAAGGFAAADYAAFLRAGAVADDALARYGRMAGRTGAAALDRALRAGPVARVAALEQEAVASASGTEVTAGPRAWESATEARTDALRAAQRVAGGQARAAAVAAVERETRRLVTLAASGAALTLMLLALGALVVRSVLRPLRNLATEAAILRDHAAELESGVREAGPGRARADAFTEVAWAVGGMHATAARLAAQRTALREGTAEALAELGRRNRDLVHRQLGAVGVLQRHESDPAALARLCELDRLTGRLRRNAESLLVLAGKRAARRSSEPVPVADVVRMTLAEMEGHHRVTLRVLDGPLVRGAVVAEVAHLLAELVENALAFSPPDAEVEIWARADEGECRITITDHGVGMTPAELAAANARLRGEESFLAAPDRCLGHHVVGRLAERLGVRVWLHETPRSGVTARVALPEELLTAASAAVERVAQP